MAPQKILSLPRWPTAALIFFALAGAAGASGCCPRRAVAPDDGVGAVPVVAKADDAQAVRETLTVFVAAVAATDFDHAYGVLSGRQRARYTVEKLRRDHEEAGGEAEALIERLSAALASGAVALIEGQQATFPLGGGLSIGLVREGDGWFIDRLR